MESAAISVPDPIKGEALVIFARVAPGTENTRELAQIISDVVSRDLGKPLKPKLVHVVATLPRTRSGKILRRVFRSVYLGETPGDTSSLEDPASLSAIGGGR
jgi:acetyl-CoA synthetase